jgi:outer membrane protein assembly factor BamB
MLRRSLPWLPALLASGLISFTFAAPAPPARNFDWPQWQGPDRTAVSREKGLLPDWPKTGPNLVWKATGLGEGFSTPTVASGRIFTMGNRGKTEYVVALAERDGKELWAVEVGPVRANGGGYPGPRCSPTVDGDRVYALGLNGDLLCLDVRTGKEIWRKDLRKDFGGRVGGWGYSESPLIDGDRLLCTPGGKKATLVALDKKTGDLIWEGVVPRGDGAHYASIIAVKVDGKRQYVQFLSGGVVGLSNEGRFLWRYDHPHNGTANCSTPLFHDNHVFAASAYGTGGGLVKLTPEADGCKAEEVYFTRQMKNHHGGMVLVDGYLYGADDGRLVCLDFKTGKVQWSEGRAGKGSLACADGRLYYRNEGGPMLLIEVNPNKYVEHGRFKQPERSRRPAWPHPVLANGKLYLRDQDKLFCYDVKNGQ